MDHPGAIYFPALIESPLPEALRPEDIGPENWYQPESIQLAPLVPNPQAQEAFEVVVSELFDPAEIVASALTLPIIRRPDPLSPNPQVQEAFIVPLPDLDVPDQDALDLPIIRFPLSLSPNPAVQESFLVPVDALDAPDVRTLPVIRFPDPLNPNPEVQEAFVVGAVVAPAETITVDKWDQPPAIPTVLLPYPTPWFDGLVVISDLFGIPTPADALTAFARNFALQTAIRYLDLTADDRDFTLTAQIP